MRMSASPLRVARRRPERFSAARTSLREAAVLLRVAKDPLTTDPEFARWVETQRFRHPQTGNDVQFKSLPVEEQAKIRARWQQTKQEEGRQRRGPGDEEKGRGEKGRGEKKEESYYDQRRRRDEQSFARWLADQDADLIETWESDRPTARSYVRKKFEKDQKRTPTYTRQKESEAKEKRWKEWLEEQGPDAQKAWSDGSQAEKLKVRGEFAKKEKAREKAEGDERRKKFDEEREKRRVPVDKFRSMSKEERPTDWVLSDNGNRIFGPSAEISAEAKLEKTDVAGKVEGQSDLKNSRVESGSRVSGSTMRGSVVEDHSVVEDGSVLTGVKVSDRARVRGSKISNAELRGGTWDDVEFDGNNGIFHDSYDPDTLRVLGSIKGRGTRGPGDGPLRAMIRYLADGGRTKGWLGGKLNREKLTRKIQQHIYDSYDRKDPWLGRGADFIEKLDDQGFGHLMDVAQEKADEIEAERRKKKAMLYELTKTALERPELRAKLMPLVRLGRDSRVAAESLELRRAVIKAAYESSDPEFRQVLVRCVVAADQPPAQAEPVLPMSQQERVEIVRAAYESRDPERRRDLLARVAYDAEHHDSLIDALSVERDAWDHPLAITADERTQLVRLAYETKDVGRRREILGLLKEAKYSPGFMKWVEKQKFKHPETGNDVQFVSLPTDEQKKIHEQWKAGKKDWAQKFKPEGLGDETLLTPEKFDQLKPGDRLWISWNPGVVHEVTGTNKTSTGKPVLEMEITNPKTGKKQTRYMHRSSAGNPQHEIHVLPEGAQPKDPKKAPKPEEKAEAKPEAKPEAEPEPEAEPKPEAEIKPKKEEAKPEAKISDDARDSLDGMNANAKSWMEALGMPGHGAEFGDEDAPFAEDDIIEIEEGGYAPLKLKVKAPKLVVGPAGTAMMAEYLPGQKLEGTTLIPIGSKYEPKSMKKIEGPKKPEKVEKPKEEAKKPEKAEAPKATGKYKDRKKLVGKGKSGDAKVRMTATVKDSFVPEGLSDEAKKATEAGFKGLTYDGLRKLESNVRAAVEDPEGAYAKALAESGYTPGDLSKMHATIKDLLKGADGRTYNKTVLDIANKYDLEGEDADELREFRSDKPGFGRKLTPNELMQKFLAKAKPETKERMQGMAIDDFMAMYNAIMADEDEEEDLS